ncbi:MAG: hypothetical protein EHM54_01400 [Nitrospiraceae bacterium]|nr:MAG: hypothetical protein EHM54_01400 [Nitrospiraceae bacterium]
MNSEAIRNYKIRKEENTLIFITPMFRAEPDSVLHSGIYNREFASVLASATVAGIIYVITAMNIENSVVRSLVFLLVFTAGFPFFRTYVFRESLMEVVFNAASSEARIYTSWITKRLKEAIALSSIKHISIEKKTEEVKNPDAVKFVEKISLQHGTIIPGFGEEKILFLLKLHLADGSERIIYSDSVMQDVLSAHDEIKEFLKI